MRPLLSEDPSTIGPYRLLGRLGEGGMGCVYLGRSAGGRTVAVKVVKSELVPDTEFRARFRREVDAARRVGGAWTAPVLDADTESSQPWVASGYVAGLTLSEAVAQFGPLPEPGVRALVAGLAEALTAVHGAGLIHRDIKPSNVMLSPAGPVLIDFGIARAMDGSATASLTSTGITIGSPGYMSPEQVQGQPLGAASDVFQLGTVLAFAATGQGPFSADSAATMLYKVAHGEPDLGHLTGELREAAEACLTKDPARRPTPGRLATRLAPGGAGELVEAGWLTAPLLARISRLAVELLDLEADGQRAAVPAPPIGPGAHRTVRLTPAQERPVRRRRRIPRGLLAGLAVLSAGAVAATTAVLLDSGDEAIPPAFSGEWQGQVSDGAALNGDFILWVPTGSGRSTPIKAFANILASVTPAEGGGLCRVVYSRRSVTDRLLHLAATVGSADGPSCSRYFDADVAVARGDDGTLRISWTDHDGKQVSGSLTKHGPSADTATTPPGPTASPSSTALVGPYRQVSDLCAEIDTSGLVKVLGPLSGTPASRTGDAGNGATDLDCGMQFGSGTASVHVTATVFPDRNSAERRYTEATPGSPTDVTRTSVPIGAQGVLEVDPSPLGSDLIMNDSVIVQDGNLFVNAFTVHSRNIQDAAVTSAVEDALRGMMAGLK